jgi:hypothetical protein
MFDKKYYEAWNKNDDYEIKKDILNLVSELEGDFDVRLKKLLGPKKVKAAAPDVRRSCRIMINILKDIQSKVQMTKEDYNSDYS